MFYHSNNNTQVMHAAMCSTQSYLIDSGATISGVRSNLQLANITKCNVPITPAFGRPINASAQGTIIDRNLHQLKLTALYIDGMNENLLSVHQLCSGGQAGIQQVRIFTSEGCRFFPLEKNRDILRDLSVRQETLSGLATGGVYKYTPKVSSHTN